MKKFLKWTAIGVGGLFGLLMLIAIITQLTMSPEEKAKQEAEKLAADSINNAKSNETKKKNAIEDSLKVINKLKSLNKEWTEKVKKGKVLNKQDAVSFASRLKSYQKYHLEIIETPYRSVEINKLIEENTKLLKTIMEVNYPIARALASKLLNEKMFADDYKVSTYGFKDEILVIEGFRLALNKAKLDMVAELEKSKIDQLYRFNQVHLRIHSHDDGAIFNFSVYSDTTIAIE